MASSTPSAPINSSRGTADTSAGRIYFSTPSAQVRVPVGDLVFPPPPRTYAHTILLEEKLSGGGKIIRRPKIYAAAEKLSRTGAGGPKIRKNILKLSHSAEKTLFPILINCETIPYPYTLSKRLS